MKGRHRPRTAARWLASAPWPLLKTMEKAKGGNPTGANQYGAGSRDRSENAIGSKTLAELGRIASRAETRASPPVAAIPLYKRAASLSAQRGEHGAAGAAVRMQAGP
jgi:hypothetical protein